MYRTLLMRTLRILLLALAALPTGGASFAQQSDVDQVKGQARRAKASVDSALSDATDKGRAAVDAVRDVADTFGEALEDSLQRRPYATLALAAGIGFLFGATWRR